MGYLTVVAVFPWKSGKGCRQFQGFATGTSNEKQIPEHLRSLVRPSSMPCISGEEMPISDGRTWDTFQWLVKFLRHFVFELWRADGEDYGASSSHYGCSIMSQAVSPNTVRELYLVKRDKSLIATEN
jgi:hypothetical protein